MDQLMVEGRSRGGRGRHMVHDVEVDNHQLVVHEHVAEIDSGDRHSNHDVVGEIYHDSCPDEDCSHGVDRDDRNRQLGRGGEESESELGHHHAVDQVESCIIS